MARIEFETPVIFGALCDEDPEVPTRLERMLRDRVKNAVLLPFQVEARHLKNVVECMRLMDVMGLAVMGGHRKRMLRHLPRLDRSARSAGRVDVVARKGKGFIGYCAEEMALSEWQKEAKKTASCRQTPPAAKLTKRTREISVTLLTKRYTSN